MLKLFQLLIDKIAVADSYFRRMRFGVAIGRRVEEEEGKRKEERKGERRRKGRKQARMGGR